MLKIGDFSRLSQVSVKTLRYYDEVALLKPTQVDEMSGYRYYSVAQLRQLHRILALRDLGFSLDQIGYVLEADLSIEELRGMLRLRRAEQQQRLLKGIRQSNAPSGSGVFLMQFRDDGNCRGWHREAAKPPRN